MTRPILPPLRHDHATARTTAITLGAVLLALDLALLALVLLLP